VPIAAVTIYGHFLARFSMRTGLAAVPVGSTWWDKVSAIVLADRVDRVLYSLDLPARDLPSGESPRRG
jgi:hypothetical protein